MSRWNSAYGGMTHEDVRGVPMVAISIGGRSAEGNMVGQRVLISRDRYARHYARTLEHIVRDLGKHDIA